MSTRLWIGTITNNDIELNRVMILRDDLLLSEEFLFKIVVNRDLLKKWLTEEEIKYIRPNWGEIDLKSTESLIGSKRKKYLDLLKEVIRTNSDKKLNQFLYKLGITSDKYIDRARSPKKTLEIIRKISKNLKKNAEHVEFLTEIKNFTNFLQKRIKNDEFILIEFQD